MLVTMAFIRVERLRGGQAVVVGACSLRRPLPAELVTMAFTHVEQLRG